MMRWELGIAHQEVAQPAVRAKAYRRCSGYTIRLQSVLEITQPSDPCMASKSVKPAASYSMGVTSYCFSSTGAWDITSRIPAALHFGNLWKQAAGPKTKTGKEEVLRGIESCSTYGYQRQGQLRIPPRPSKYGLITDASSDKDHKPLCTATLARPINKSNCPCIPGAGDGHVRPLRRRLRRGVRG